MGFFERLLLVLGLAADGFAAAVCIGLSLPRGRSGRRAVAALAVTALHVLLFALGYALGGWGAARLGAWCALLSGALLLLLGLWSLREAALNERKTEPLGAAEGLQLWLLALSSSLDAMTVGLSYALLGEPLGPALGLVAAVMGALALLGLWLGRLFGRGLRRRAVFAGGVILCLLGLKNLWGG